jgi:glycerol dehydrogenase
MPRKENERMIDIISPKRYLNAPGALAETGALVSPLAKRALLVGSKTALAVAGDALRASLCAAGVAHETHEYNGFPTREAAQVTALRAKKCGAEALIATGGGRIMDTVKTAGAYSGLPVVAVPTIAATCAPWAPVAILYTVEGAFSEAVPYKQSPVLVVADSDVLAKAPARYLRSGIADTFAKWYEVSPSLKHSDDIYLRLSVKYGELAREILESKGASVAAAPAVCSRSDFADVLDAIFLLAGLCGSIKSINKTQGIAHPLYNAFSLLPELRPRLHGEKVAFGLVAQGILEGQSEGEIAHRLALFTTLQIPLTLASLGLTDGVDAKLALVCAAVKKMVPVYKALDTPYTEADLLAAIKKASLLAEDYQKTRLQKAG